MASMLVNAGPLSAPKTAGAAVPVHDVFGRRIRSFVPLPAPKVAAAPDWELVEAAEALMPDPPANCEELAAAPDPDVFEARGFARFVFSGRRIEMRRNQGLVTRDLLGVVTGTLTALMLARDGRLVLHGTTLHRRGRAVVICGLAGAGKSTQSAYLACNGWNLHADDVAPIEWTDGAPAIFPGYDVIRLFPDSLRLLGLDPEAHPRLHARATKRLVTLGSGRAFAGGAVPIAGVVLLVEGDDFAVWRMPGREAVVTLLNMQHPTAARTADLSPTGRIAVFQDCAALARCVPVLEVRRAKTAANLARTEQAIAAEFGLG